MIGVDRKLYSAHRLAWLIAYGEFPKYQIDHINAIRSDNRMTNLRACTQKQNNENTSPRRKDVLMGVVVNQKHGTFYARIGHQGRTLYLGSFTTQEAAHLAYQEAKQRLHRFQPTLRAATKHSF